MFPNPAITPASILTGLAALLWLITLFAALAGWGYLLARPLRLANPESALALTLGLATQCLLGSLLNLAHLIRTPILLVIIGAGLIAFLYHRLTQPSASLAQLGQASRPALLLIAILILLHLITFIHPPAYEVMDDLQAYILLPVKMLQLHHLAPDPFSQRRIIGSLAFNYYLQDLFLTLAPLKNLTLVDGAGGILTLCAVALGLSRTLGLTRNQTLGFLLIVGLTKQIWWNLGFMWLPCALFLALAYLVSLPALQSRLILQPLILGAVGGAAGALKNNHLVFSVLYVVIVYALLATVEPAARLRFFLTRVTLAAAAAFTVIAAWMFDLHRYSGTYFFPVLGHGFEFTTYGLLPVRHLSLNGAILKVLLSGLPILLVAAIAATLLLWQNRRTSRPDAPLPTWTTASVALLALTVTGGTATAITALATGADNIRRYCYPEIIVALLALPSLVFFLLNRRPALRFARTLQACAIAIVALAFASDVWNSVDHWLSPALYWKRHLTLSHALRNAPINDDRTTAEYQAVQASLPPHAVVVEQALYPYLFDNNRNTIYEASLPAMASPPPAPGWPILSDGNALAAWFLSHNVRYLIYSYGDGSGWPDPFLEEQSINPGQTAIMHSTLTADLLAHKQYLQLYRTRRRLFDDNRIFVLDLSSITGAP